MHIIKINRLTLENFKCHENLTLDFQGQDAALYGDNAAGKTSVYDGLTWLLFGKDSAGNAEGRIDIKPLDGEGNVKDHQAITSVEAVLDVDGVRKTLKRSLREIWTTRRGSAGTVYDGNTTDYAIDGVPLKKNAYDAQVRELVPEDLFRMLTAVDYLPLQMSWQKRRAVLFDMAGTLTDRQIMEQDPQFAPLLEGMGTLDLGSYRARLLHEKKGFTGTRDEAPARLSELQKTLDILGGLDFAEARRERSALESDLEQVKGEILAIDRDSAVEGLRMEIRGLDQDLRELTARNEEFRRNHFSSRREQELRQAVQDGELLLSRKNHALSLRRSEDQQAREHNRRMDQKLTAREQELERELGDLRAEWSRISSLTFTGSKCPACGQELPADQLMEAMQRFRKDQSEKLASIQKNAELMKQEKEGLRTRNPYEDTLDPEALQTLEKEAADQLAAVEKARAELAAARNQPVPDMEGYGEQRQLLREKREELEHRVEDLVLGSGNHRISLEQKARRIGEAIQEQDRILAREELKKGTEQRMAALREDQQNAAAGAEAIDRMLYLTEEFTRFKAQFVESGINSLFRLAKFRLFRTQANGGLEERCDVCYGGVPYESLNNGMRINLGVDIINALSRFYGVQVPLFIDNAESVTRLEESHSQTIRLVVSENDKELRKV